jgi:hypothetical protein
MLSGEMLDNVIVGVSDCYTGRDAVGLATRLGSGKPSLALAYRAPRDRRAAGE